MTRKCSICKKEGHTIHHCDSYEIQDLGINAMLFFRRSIRRILLNSLDGREDPRPNEYIVWVKNLQVRHLRILCLFRNNLATGIKKELETRVILSLIHI